MYIQPLSEDNFLRLQGYPLPILNIFVPQTGQVPWVAGFPFFMVIALGSFISLLARHLTQYASIRRTSFILVTKHKGFCLECQARQG